MTFGVKKTLLTLVPTLVAILKAPTKLLYSLVTNTGRTLRFRIILGVFAFVTVIFGSQLDFQPFHDFNELQALTRKRLNEMHGVSWYIDSLNNNKTSILADKVIHKYSDQIELLLENVVANIITEYSNLTITANNGIFTLEDKILYLTNDVIIRYPDNHFIKTNKIYISIENESIVIGKIDQSSLDNLDIISDEITFSGKNNLVTTKEKTKIIYKTE